MKKYLQKLKNVIFYNAIRLLEILSRIRGESWLNDPIPTY